MLNLNSKFTKNWIINSLVPSLAKYFISVFFLNVLTLLFNSCGNSNNQSLKDSDTSTKQNINCDFNSVQFEAYEVGTDKLLDKKIVSGCFVKKIIDEQLGLVEVKDTEGKIKVTYYIESDPNLLKFLDVKIGDAEPSRWRANKGHDLFILEENNQLNFIFGDRLETKIKGTIKFE
jgi:hypothetical protein